MNVNIGTEEVGLELAENAGEFIEVMSAIKNMAGGMFFDDLHDAHSKRTEEIAQFLRRAADAMSGIS